MGNNSSARAIRSHVISNLWERGCWYKTTFNVWMCNTRAEKCIAIGDKDELHFCYFTYQLIYTYHFQSTEISRWPRYVQPWRTKDSTIVSTSLYTSRFAFKPDSYVNCDLTCESYSSIFCELMSIKRASKNYRMQKEKKKFFSIAHCAKGHHKLIIEIELTGGDFVGMG